MPDFRTHITEVLNLGSQGSGGDAETMVKAAINNVYRRVLRLSSTEMRKREFTVNVSAPTQAAVTGSNTENFTITPSSSDAVKIKVDGGVSQTVTLTAGTRTASQIASDINSGTDLVTASASSSGAVTLTSPSYGRRSSVEIETVSNNAYSVLGFSVATTRGTNDYQYGMPLYARTELYFDSQQDSGPVEVVTASEGSRLYRPTIDTGTPEIYWRVGQYGVEKQPSTTGGAISFVSSSASDDTTTHITVIGYLNGNLVREKKATDGTSTVTTTQTFDEIERVIKTADGGVSWVGVVTIKDASSNTLAEIPTWVRSPSYQWVQFEPIPDSDTSYILTAQSAKPDLLNDEDWPEFDELFHDLLTNGACAEVLPAFGKPSYAQMYSAMYENRIKEFQSYVDPLPSLVQESANVQSNSISGGRGSRGPWVAGVHRGLAAGQ